MDPTLAEIDLQANTPQRLRRNWQRLLGGTQGSLERWADSNYVPYTGANDDVDLGAHALDAAALTATGLITAASGGSFETLLGDNSNGRSFYTSVGGRQTSIGDAVNDVGLLVDNGTNSLSVLDSSGNITLGGNENIFSSPARFDDYLDNPTSWDFRVSNTTEMTLSSTELDLQSNDITTTGRGTFGDLDVDTLNLNGNAITDSTGTIDFDDDALTTTGTIDSHDITITGDGATPALIINQGADLEGLRINGYDDESSYYYELRMGAYGGMEGLTNGYWKMNTGSRLEFNAGGDIIFDVGSNDHFRVRDGSNDVKFQVAESDGSVGLPNDNQKLLLGAGDDSAIWYDGTDMHVDPQLVGSGDLLVDNGNMDIVAGALMIGGTQRLSGTAPSGYTTFSNLTTDRTCDANSTTVDELADILGTLIEDLKAEGVIST